MHREGQKSKKGVRHLFQVEIDVTCNDLLEKVPDPFFLFFLDIVLYEPFVKNCELKKITPYFPL